MPHPTAMRHVPLILILALCSACSAGQETTGPDFTELAGVFRKHCVRVYIQGKTFQGESPAVGDFADDITNERPTLVGGYWWDERHIIIEDPVLQDQYIRSIEIGLPFSDLRYPARVASRFITIPAILLEVFPGENGVLPQAFPLNFDDGDLERCAALSYVWERGEWRIRSKRWAGPRTLSDAGAEAMELGANGILFTGDSVAVGIAFGDVVVNRAAGDWTGASVSSAKTVWQDEVNAATGDMGERLAETMLETKFRLRIRIEDDDDESWSVDLNRAGADPTEVKAAGMVVGPRHMFVPVPLQAESIARIERIAVTLHSGREITAHFVGACREYEAIVIETDEELPADLLPPGFAMLNPMVVPEEAFNPETVESEQKERLFFRWQIDYRLGRRREQADYDRWLGTFRGFRGDPVVLTGTNEKDGALAFDTEGRLIAVAVTPRIVPTRDGEGNSLHISTGFKPVEYLHAQLQKSDVFDPTLAPVDEEDGRRLVDLGVEYQKLDANTARLFNAAAETRGGTVGMLVTHVYPGSTADTIGLREQDILLRLFIQGKREPVELSADDAYSNPMHDFENMSTESMQQTLSYMPPPWTSRENTLSIILTGAGVGKRAALELVREGEPLRLEFVTEYTAPDYRNAQKSRFDRLGLTVKPVTYEVARYFLRPDQSGVIVSKVEDGGKASVAGTHPYQLITRVDGAPVRDIADFAERIGTFESGNSGAIELTMETFGKTRLVRIENR